MGGRRRFEIPRPHSFIEVGFPPLNFWRPPVDFFFFGQFSELFSSKPSRSGACSRGLQSLPRSPFPPKLEVPLAEQLTLLSAAGEGVTPATRILQLPLWALLPQSCSALQSSNDSTPGKPRNLTLV